MPGTLRLNQKQLMELIQAIEGEGGDATELRTLLAETNQGGQPRKGSRPLGPIAEEPTTQERLESEVGYLFPGGVTSDLLTKLIEFDRDHSLEDLKRMCVGAEISPRGHKKQLAAKLIAHESRHI